MKKLPGLNEMIGLTRKESVLLFLLLASAGHTVTRQTIAEKLCPGRPFAESRDVIYGHVKNLRNKIKAAGYTCTIDTVYDAGYRLRI